MNIQGVRVNVSGLSGNINATVVPSPANVLTFPAGQNQTVVGRAQATIGAVTATGATVGQCAIPTAPSTANLAAFFGNTPLILGAGAAASTPTAYTTANTMTLAVAEPNTFPTAFTSAAFEAAITPGGIGPAALAAQTAATLGFQGLAAPVTVGVRLVLTFSGIPSGVSLVVPTTVIQTAAATSGMTWNLVSPTPSPALAAAQANIVASSSGAAAVTYELVTVSAQSATTVDTITFIIGFSAPTGTVVPTGSLGAASVSVGPVSATATFSASAGATLRFAANTGVTAAAAIGTIGPCLTNLLFPFVSNRAGTTFNTGIAISNTAKDSGTTSGETGGVTLYFNGISAPTGGSAGIAMPIAAIAAGGTVATSGVIAPGEHTVLLLTDGTAASVATGFQGYIVALCNFRYAHGFALILDNFGVGAANVGFSYLPLVLNGSATGRTGTNNVAPIATVDTLGN
jgi:hypothetical protein